MAKPPKNPYIMAQVTDAQIDATWERAAAVLRAAISDKYEEAAGLRGAAVALERSATELERIARKGEWWKLRGVGMSERDIELMSEVEPADRDEWLDEEVLGRIK